MLKEFPESGFTGLDRGSYIKKCYIQCKASGLGGAGYFIPSTDIWPMCKIANPPAPESVRLWVGGLNITME